MTAEVLPDRIRSKFVASESGCWEWQAGRNAAGYGIVGFGPGSRSHLAHRVTFLLVRGPIPAGLELDHLCQNRRCVNPDHLEPVVHRENVRRADMSGNGAEFRDRDSCSQGHRYTPENTLHRVRNGSPRRICRACHARNAAASRRRLNAV
jgi:hypothetical protein